MIAWDAALSWFRSFMMNGYSVLTLFIHDLNVYLCGVAVPHDERIQRVNIVHT